MRGGDHFDLFDGRRDGNSGVFGISGGGEDINLLLLVIEAALDARESLQEQVVACALLLLGLVLLAKDFGFGDHEEFASRRSQSGKWRLRQRIDGDDSEFE